MQRIYILLLVAMTTLVSSPNSLKAKQLFKEELPAVELFNNSDKTVTITYLYEDHLTVILPTKELLKPTERRLLKQSYSRPLLFLCLEETEKPVEAALEIPTEKLHQAQSSLLLITVITSKDSPKSLSYRLTETLKQSPCNMSTFKSQTKKQSDAA